MIDAINIKNKWSLFIFIKNKKVGISIIFNKILKYKIIN